MFPAALTNGEPGCLVSTDIPSVISAVTALFTGQDTAEQFVERMVSISPQFMEAAVNILNLCMSAPL